jgi:hypothetical protein
MMRTWKAIAGAAGRQAILFLAAVLVLGGCTSIKNAAKSLKDGSPAVSSGRSEKPGDMKKKAVILGIEPASPAATPGFGAHFQTAISAALEKECRSLLLDQSVAASLKTPPRRPSGVVDGYALAVLGRGPGVNFFVFGSLNDIRFLEEKSGFWLWKDTRYSLRAAVRVEIFDVETATKILDESLSEEMLLDEVTYQQFQPGGRIALGDLQTPLAVIMRKAAQRTCATLRDQPWRGFVVGSDPQKITISAGLSAGLATGRALEVFEKGQVIESKDGQRYIRPGAKIGEAVITSASTGAAEAALTGAGAGASGGVVRIKP